MSYERAAHELGQLARSVGRTLCSFETLFVLFLFSGTFRLSPTLRWIPANLTLVFMVAGVLCGAYALWRRGWCVPHAGLVQVLWIAGLFSLLALSLLWTPATTYARDKTVAVLGACGWATVGSALIIAESPERIQRFVVLLVALAVVVALVAAPQPGDRLIASLGANYLNVGRLVGLGLVGVLAYLLLWNSTFLQRLAGLVLLLLLTYVLLNLRGRGPLLAAGVAALCPLLVGVRVVASGRVRVQGYALVIGVGLLVLALLLIILLLVGSALPFSLSRLVAGLSSGIDSDAQRLELLDAALTAWRQRPLWGHGVGAFAVIFTGAVDNVYYPHNIILELLSEFGLAGLTLFSLALWQSLRALGGPRRWRNDPWRLVLAMLLVHALVNALLSGDLAGNRALFALMGLLTGLAPRAAGPAPANVRGAA